MGFGLESDCSCEAIIQYDIDWRSLGARSMKVRRIIANVATSDVEKASAFYHDVLGLELIMDLGWIRTYGPSAEMTIQVSVASEGGSGTDVPDTSPRRVRQAVSRVMGGVARLRDERYQMASPRRAFNRPGSTCHRKQLGAA